MTFDYQASPVTSRLIEECAEELGRLDALVAMAPGSVPLLLQNWTVARLATPDAQAMRVASAALVASSVEITHAASLPEDLEAWQRRLDDGERRARSGVPLAVPEHLALEPAARVQLVDALRPGGQPRSVLLRAVCVAGVIEAGTRPAGSAEAELLAALLITAAGTTDRVRMLPFAEFTSGRAEAIEAWRAGDTQPFTHAALSALAPAARRLRLQVRLLLDARVAEDEHLSSIGRAAVTGRRALQVLRDSLATSMPDLAQRLDCSRPAAGDALERLVELGLAEEITGRGRDRVYVWAGAWALG
jgi:hypothetical protein